MLNCDEIAKLLSQRSESKRSLLIIPQPDLVEVRSSGASSIDLRLGRWLKAIKQTRQSEITLTPTNEAELQGTVTASIKEREYFVPFGEHFTLHSGRFVLGVTLEWIRLSSRISGYITGKSSLGRFGLVIETASGIQPGFNGCLTLELSNVGEVPLRISPGMKICQVFFFGVRSAAVTKQGSFSGRRKPVVGSPKGDAIIDMLRS